MYELVRLRVASHKFCIQANAAKVSSVYDSAITPLGKRHQFDESIF